MKSGLEDRNNQPLEGNREQQPLPCVSMKSGLEDRNNLPRSQQPTERQYRLNEVRPGRPEQCEMTVLADVKEFLSQ